MRFIVSLLLFCFTTAEYSTFFNFTGVVQYYTVPAGYYYITVYAYGASGGNNTYSTRPRIAKGPGFGGAISATIPVTPGQVLGTVHVDLYLT